jgi:hypothetical protein
VLKAWLVEYAPGSAPTAQRLPALSLRRRVPTVIIIIIIIIIIIVCVAPWWADEDGAMDLDDPPAIKEILTEILPPGGGELMFTVDWCVSLYADRDARVRTWCCIRIYAPLV